MHWQGITPKINVSYLNIDSNMPAFYSRDRWQSYLSFTKTF
ncbi:surface lipoprotein assembly modifier [Suttonella sp. R2A3]